MNWKGTHITYHDNDNVDANKDMRVNISNSLKFKHKQIPFFPTKYYFDCYDE